MADDAHPSGHDQPHGLSRRSSSFQEPPAPRRRRSVRSLSQTPKSPGQTPILTSFEPFTPPANARSSSQDSCSSSKRSRSIYAPDRQNSIGPEHVPRVRSTASLQSPPLPPPKLTRTMSQAKKSLIMNTVMDIEGKEDSMFTEHDLKYFRQQPSVLAEMDNKRLRELSKTQSYFDIIRTLGGDLAQRDAEMVTLRRRMEELSKIFKDHLCSEHDLSRLDADRTLHSLGAFSRTSADLSMARSMEEAADTELFDPTSNPFSDQHAAGAEFQPRADQEVDERSDESKAQPTRSGMKGVFSVFAGRGKQKRLTAAETARKQETPRVREIIPARTSAMRRRRSSVGSSSIASSKNLVNATLGPVEMNSIIEAENLPPPLTTQRDVRAQYPGYSADVYGFVIDAERIGRFMDENGVVSPSLRSRGSETPRTSASSIKSVGRESGPDSADSEVEEIEQSAWTSYLKFDPSALGSLAWLPIASASALPPEDSELSADSPIEMGQAEAVKVLQQSISDDFERLQKSRTIPWEKFLSQDRTQNDSASSYMPSMFRRNDQKAARQGQSMDTVPRLINLPPSLRAERTRLVLNGIPMALRAQIYTSIALETLQPEPDEYRNLVLASATAVDATLLSEIEDDIPRTLPNNVFFRPGATASPHTQRLPLPQPSAQHRSKPRFADSKGRSALRELLLAFLTRRPEIGYCQGMNLIAGYLLLCLPSTEAAFWVFTYLIEHVLSDTYFDATLRGASIEICVLRSYVDELIPRLARKLDESGVDGRESAPYNWFLTAYASALSVEAVYRVWDVLLGLGPGKGPQDGSSFPIRLGVGLCKAFEEEMLALEGGFEIRGFMDGMGVGGVAAAAARTARRNGPRRRGLSVAARKANGISIDGLIKASWKLGAVIKDDEVRRRRKHFALKIDESAFG